MRFKAVKACLCSSGTKDGQGLMVCKSSDVRPIIVTSAVLLSPLSTPQNTTDVVYFPTTPLSSVDLEFKEQAALITNVEKVVSPVC